MRLSSSPIRAIALFIALAFLAGCQETSKAQLPVPRALLAKMERLGMDAMAPIYIRIFKEDSQLEVWKKKRDGEYALLKSYAICKWSGELGPKIAEGDRQAPEGFYTVTPAQMNPNSSYYLSFNIGYPNAYDAALGRTGGNLMVHGACSSAGCYSMDDENAGEIFALARDAFKGGQTSFQVHAFPFRMTPQKMAQHRDNTNFAFWRMLKEGYDHFEVTRTVPGVDVCDKHYVFNADAKGAAFDAKRACPSYSVPEPIRVAVLAKQAADEKVYASLAPAEKTVVAAVTPIPAKTTITPPASASHVVASRANDTPAARKRTEISTASVISTGSVAAKPAPAKTDANKTDANKADAKTRTGTSANAAKTSPDDADTKPSSLFDQAFGPPAKLSKGGT